MANTMAATPITTHYLNPQAAINRNVFNDEECEVGAGNGICGLRGNSVLRTRFRLVPPARGVTFMGNRNPTKLQEAAHEVGGRLRLVPVIGEIRTDTTVIKGGDEQFYGGKSSLDITHGDVDLFLAELEAFGTSDIGLITGSMTPGLPVGRDLYVELAEQLRARKALIGLDVRAGDFNRLYGDHGLRPNHWKANLHEFEGIVREDLTRATFDEIVHHIVRILPDAYVMVSLAHRGLVVRSPDGRALQLSAELPPGHIRKSAVGAGDLTWSTFVELLKFMDFEEASHFATALGVSGLENLIPGFARIDIMDQVINRVRVLARRG